MCIIPEPLCNKLSVVLMVFFQNESIYLNARTFSMVCTNVYVL